MIHPERETTLAAHWEQVSDNITEIYMQMLHTNFGCFNKVPTLLFTKNSSTFPGLPKTFFPGLCRSPAMLNYRQTAVTYSVYMV